jgi:hypothetical protein
LLRPDSTGDLRRSLVVVEATLARLVVALAPLRAGIAPPLRATCVTTAGGSSTGASAGIVPATTASTTAGEVRTPVAHRAAVTGRRAAVSTAATAAATVAATTAAAAIATATAAAVAAATTAIATTAATAIGRTRAARTEAAAIAATTATAAAKSAATATAGLTLDSFTDGDRAAVEESSVHGLHRCRALIVGFHFEERETTAAAGLAIHDHF